MSKSESKVYYIKVLLDTIQAYQLANKPQNLGNILFHIVNHITISGYNKEPSDPMDLLYYAKTLEAVDEGLEAYRKMVVGGGKGGTTTAQRNAERKERNAAEPSAPLSLPPPVAPVVAEPAAPVKPAHTGADFKITDEEITRNFSRTDDAEIFGDTMTAISKMLGGQFDAYTRNTMRKFMRTKNKKQVADIVSEVYHEYLSGEHLRNPAERLTKRLKELPDLKQPKERQA